MAASLPDKPKGRTMKVSQSVETRISCRAFLDKEPPQAIVRELIDKAKRAPSGGNLQPWYVHAVRGDKLKEISDAAMAKINEGTMIEKSEYHVYPPKLIEPYRTRRTRVGEMMYGLLDIPREDKASRIKQFVANYRFFDAPVAMFFSMNRMMCEGQWADLGMFIQTIMLLAREYGLHTCPQECWAAFSPTVRAALNIPDDHIFFCGLSIGYMDEDNPINQLKTERADENEFATFIGFDD